MKKDLLSIPSSALITLPVLSNQQAGKLFKAIYAYHTDPGREAASLDQITSVLYDHIRSEIDLLNSHRATVSHSRSLAGSKGGRPPKAPSPAAVQTAPVPAASVPASRPVPADTSAGLSPAASPAPVPAASAAGLSPAPGPASPPSKKFTRPTLIELEQYIKDYAISHSKFPTFTAQKFIDYYDSVGWIVGRTKKPMKDWRSAVRTWFNQPQRCDTPEIGREQISTKVFEQF